LVGRAPQPVALFALAKRLLDSLALSNVKFCPLPELWAPFLVPHDISLVAQPYDTTITGEHAVLQLEVAVLGGFDLRGPYALAVVRVKYLAPVLRIFCVRILRVAQYHLDLRAVVQRGMGLNVLNVDDGRNLLDQRVVTELGLLAPVRRRLVVGSIPAVKHHALL
jgi:hypothetical protein